MKPIDMHCDTISVLLEQKRDGKAISLRENNLHLDLMKMQRGRYQLQNFALFIYTQNGRDPLEEALCMADLYYKLLAENADLIRPVYSYADIEHNRYEGRMSAMLTIEEGAACKGDVSLLHTFYRLGVRMMTLTWNFPNEIGHPNFTFPNVEKPDSYSVPDMKKPDTVHGLTPTGIEFIREMERIGMIIDVSHLSDAGFYDVLEHTHVPFVASHSNARAVCNNVRNMTDDMIRRLADRGGVIGLNFCPDFLTEPVSGQPNQGTLEALVRHARHLADIGGIECIGLGSDFDGIPDHSELKNASCLPLLAEALSEAGFNFFDIEHIFYQNVLRVYRDILH